MAMKNISLCVMTALTTLVVESKVLTVKMTSGGALVGRVQQFRHEASAAEVYLDLPKPKPLKKGTIR